MIDVLTIRNVRFAYNLYGIYASHWVCNARVSGLWGYINQYSLLTLRPDGAGQYDWVVEGVSSQSDGWAANSSFPASVIDVTTYQDVSLSDVVIEPFYHNLFAPTPLVTLNVQVSDVLCLHYTVRLSCLFVLQTKGDASGEWYRGHVVMRNVRVGAALRTAMK